MKRLLPLLLVPACVDAAPTPEPFCKRLPFDEESPPGLAGTYDIVGKESGAAGQAYSGVLEIVAGKDEYVLTRTIAGTALRGAAWVESCSPDRFEVLHARYDAKPKPLELSCYLRFDGDNYTRASCTTFEAGGFEAWYQRH